MKIKLTDLQKEVISKFWSFVDEAQATVELRENEGKDTLLMWFDPEFIDDFVFLCLDPDEPYDCFIIGSEIGIDCSTFLDGYGFTMKDVWRYKHEN